MDTEETIEKFFNNKYRRRITILEKKQIREMYYNGMSANNISRVIGLSVTSIISFLRKQGVKIKTKVELKAEEYKHRELIIIYAMQKNRVITTVALAKILNLNIALVNKIRRKLEAEGKIEVVTKSERLKNCRKIKYENEVKITK
jgi:ribosomal protein S25